LRKDKKELQRPESLNTFISEWGVLTSSYLVLFSQSFHELRSGRVTDICKTLIKKCKVLDWNKNSLVWVDMIPLW
jgi:hypothetical protein